MRRFTAPLAAVLVSLAACQDDGVRSDPAPTPARGDVRTGWMVGRDGQPVQITFQVLGGQAILEGDIILGPADRVPATREALEALRKPQVGDGVRLNSVITGSTFWWRTGTSYGGTMPYEIDPSLPNPQRVYDAINHIKTNVPTLNFVVRTTETDYVRFVPNNTYPVCSSWVGRQGGMQTIELHNDCDFGSTVHELGHALGFWHEQSRCDRDQYVEILWQNIDPQWAYNFNMNCGSSTTDRNVGTDYYAYDEGSIMHYGPYYFSINGQPTIRSRRGLDYLMGQRNGLGATDITTLKTLYPGKRRACCS
jgi:hypothetical protein